MPTARELLEQADALMRRNRAAAIDDIPVLTDAVPIDEASLLGRQSVDDDDVAASSSTDSIPTLTERIESPVAVTTDLVMQEGEASDWLDFDEAQPSIIGEEPDSIAVVPPVKLAKEVDQGLLASAEHEEIELTSAVEAEFDDELAPPAEVPSDSPGPDVAPPATDANMPSPLTAQAEEPSAAALAAALAAAVPVPSSPPVAPPPEAPTASSSVASEDGEGLPDEPAMLEAAEAAAAPEPELTPATSEPEGLTAPEPELTSATLEPEGLTAPEPQLTPATSEPEGLTATEPAEAGIAPEKSSQWDDQARWDLAAEEIRMQVLQRIDLFTDTGLREQLGQRLQPIVDRASADLVATINLHVGELLRAYVAEAIEREIERWRTDVTKS